MSRLCRAALLAVALAAAGSGCGRQKTGEPGQEAQAPSPGSQEASQTQSEPAPGPVPKEIWNEFSGEKAFEHTKQLVGLGPRPSGSAAIEPARAYIRKAVSADGWQVIDQPFTDSTPRGDVRFVNLIARFSGGSGKPALANTQQVILSSHYDTKIFDTIRFVGASDGGSSTGALIELARVLSLNPALARQVELVFFDGEEAVTQFTETDGTYGSRHYARELRESKRNKQFKFGILWDMIGNKDVTITLSTDSPAELTRGIFAAAEALKLRDRFKYYSQQIWDDQVPLTHEADIPTIDLIDLEYDYWHTADDTMDKLSAESLQVVGKVTLYYLDQRLAK